jgi:hypothetical protein
MWRYSDDVVHVFTDTESYGWRRPLVGSVGLDCDGGGPASSIRCAFQLSAESSKGTLTVNACFQLTPARRRNGVPETIRRYAEAATNSR